MDGFFVGGLHNFFPEEGHSDEGDDQEIIESNEGALFSDESSCVMKIPCGRILLCGTDIMYTLTVLASRRMTLP